MGLRQTFTGIGARAFAGLLLLPFLLLSLLPAVVMPMRVADGSMVLVLCTGDGPVEVTVDAGGSDKPVARTGTCDWSAQIAAAVLPELAQTAQPVHVASAAWMGAVTGRHSTGIATRPFSTGPPVTF